MSDSLERAWRERRFDKIQKKATLKAIRLLLTAMFLLGLGGYFLIKLVF